MKSQNKKILMVIAKEKFRDEEYLETRQALEEGGIEVRVAALEAGEAIGMFGEKVNIDLTVQEVNVEDFDGVSFIGGAGIVPLVNDEQLKKLALDFYEHEDRLVTAICAAPAILANVGILSGKKATAYSGMVNTIKEGGAICEGKQVEIDGRIITADGPLSARKFGEEIVRALK